MDYSGYNFSLATPSSSQSLTPSTEGSAIVNSQNVALATALLSSSSSGNGKIYF